jgi:hypothetical protein
MLVIHCAARTLSMSVTVNSRGELGPDADEDDDARSAAAPEDDRCCKRGASPPAHAPGDGSPRSPPDGPTLTASAGATDTGSGDGARHDAAASSDSDDGRSDSGSAGMPRSSRMRAAPTPA